MKGMVVYIKLEQIAHRAGNLVYPWIAKFEHLVATLANEVVVLAETISLFVMAGILAELMAFHQTRIYQQVDKDQRLSEFYSKEKSSNDYGYDKTIA